MNEVTSLRNPGFINFTHVVWNVLGLRSFTLARGDSRKGKRKNRSKSASHYHERVSKKRKKDGAVSAVI